MSANRDIKVLKVKEITEKISQSQSVIVAEYAGLTVKQLQALRKELKASDVELKVYKNRLVKIAATELGFKDLNLSLNGPSIFAFGKSDAIAPAKILAKFAKDFKALQLKSGIYEGRVIDVEEVNVVATLPSYEEALTILASSLLAPIRYISVGLNLLVTEKLLPE